MKMTKRMRKKMKTKKKKKEFNLRSEVQELYSDTAKMVTAGATKPNSRTGSSEICRWCHADYNHVFFTVCVADTE